MIEFQSYGHDWDIVDPIFIVTFDTLERKVNTMYKPVVFRFSNNKDKLFRIHDPDFKKAFEADRICEKLNSYKG